MGNQNTMCVGREAYDITFWCCGGGVGGGGWCGWEGCVVTLVQFAWASKNTTVSYVELYGIVFSLIMYWYIVSVITLLDYPIIHTLEI